MAASNGKYWDGPLVGPMTINANLAPGGVVVRVYAVDDGELVHERRIPADAAYNVVEALAELDAYTVAWDTLGLGAKVLVAYDGDTGERMPSRAILGDGPW